jgi:hypothetical protein
MARKLSHPELIHAFDYQTAFTADDCPAITPSDGADGLAVTTWTVERF